MADIKHINLKEFRELGFLQEANRLFFHPHGLALEISIPAPDLDKPVTVEQDDSSPESWRVEYYGSDGEYLVEYRTSGTILKAVSSIQKI